MTEKLIPVLALTPGDPAGIGLDLALQIAAQPLACKLAVLADHQAITARAKLLNADVELLKYEGQAHQAGKLTLLQPDVAAQPAVPGKLNPANSAYVLETIRLASDGCLSGQFDAMVTGPVHKGIINEAGIAFTGHTEYIASRCGSPQPVMVLANDHLRVALVTIHMPLREVADAITAQRLSAVIEVLNADLQQKFGIAKPAIMVCGLNPHAGEDGHLGMEEIEVITPTLNTLRKKGIQLIGPIPADTAFTPASLQRVDAVLAMYHDQGLPVIKSQGFGEIVNITLGLPIIRTSVDHGTALGLAGTGKADDASLLKAIEQAIKMVAFRKQTSELREGLI